MDAASLYSPDYPTARKRFRQASARLGLQLQSHLIDQRGPKGEELTIDVALSPVRSSDPLLVVSSGIHGVEGFFGSAVQLSVLEQLFGQPGSLPPIRLLLVHGLNPVRLRLAAASQRGKRGREPEFPVGRRGIQRQSAGLCCA